MATEDVSTFKQIFLSKWMPAMLAAAIGGPIVAVLAPWLQSQYSEEVALANKKLELWESIGENFSNYINHRGRLNRAARWQKEHKENEIIISTNFLLRKEQYREKRDQFGDALRRDFLLAEFYYSSAVASIISDFLDWHAQYRIATVEFLPTDEEYMRWRDKIMREIKKELD